MNGPIVCIGAANTDRKLRLAAPLAMGTSNPARAAESFGGVARNIAENLARLGAPVALMSAVGDDAAGRALLAHAARCGIDTGATLTLAGAASGSYTALLDPHGEMTLALADMALYEHFSADVMAARAPRLCAALTVADLNLPHDAVRALLQNTPSLVLVAVSEPKMDRLPRDLAGLRLLILNSGELAARAGAPLATGADFEAACRALQRQGAQDVIVTRGAAGVMFTTPGGGMASLSTPASAVIDVTGAGDAFAAGVCWSLFNSGPGLELACRRGLRLAAMTLACDSTVCPDIAPGCLDDIFIPAPNQD